MVYEGDADDDDGDEDDDDVGDDDDAGDADDGYDADDDDDTATATAVTTRKLPVNKVVAPASHTPRQEAGPRDRREAQAPGQYQTDDPKTMSGVPDTKPKTAQTRPMRESRGERPEDGTGKQHPQQNQIYSEV